MELPENAVEIGQDDLPVSAFGLERKHGSGTLVYLKDTRHLATRLTEEWEKPYGMSLGMRFESLINKFGLVERGGYKQWESETAVVLRLKASLAKAQVALSEAVARADRVAKERDEAKADAEEYRRAAQALAKAGRLRPLDHRALSECIHHAFNSWYDMKNPSIWSSITLHLQEAIHVEFGAQKPITQEQAAEAYVGAPAMSSMNSYRRARFAAIGILPERTEGHKPKDDPASWESSTSAEPDPRRNTLPEDIGMVSVGSFMGAEWWREADDYPADHFLPLLQGGAGESDG